MKEIKLRTFLNHFCENIREDKKYCFILGSGASKPSGIPTGAELVKQWMAELTDSYDTDDLDSWKAEEGISMDDLAKDYSKIFDKRFELNKKDGFAFLEKIMEGKEPSCGYSVLAQILDTKRHKVVITTNFDSLTEDALFIYARKKPLVVVHEALANYIKPFGTRPIIVKIHRDLLLTPKNTTDETSELEANFARNLTDIFKYYTPIVIGYGGNDGSLMGFLEELNEIEGGIFWFYREQDGGLSPRIKNLIGKFDGCAIPIPGFDDLMIQIGNRLELERLDKKVVEIAEQRAKNYREQIERVTEENTTPKETKDAVSNMVSRGTKDWFYYEIEASKTENITKRDKIYQEGIKSLPNSAELHGNYALFLKNIRKEYDKAAVYYKKAIELDPNGANKTGNYALFLHNIRKEYDKAEMYYKKTIGLDPNDATHIGNYATFLSDIRKEYDKAEVYYKKAIELDPNNANTTGNYASFLYDIRKEYDKAEVYYKKAIELDPNDANTTGNYASFLYDIRKEYDKAEVYYKKAIELDPNHANTTGNYATFLSYIRKEYDNAEVYYKKAIELDPNNANNTGNYAKHLIVRGKTKRAKSLIQKAFELNQNKNEGLNLELWFYRYAIFFDEYKEAEKNIEDLLNKGVQSVGWYLDDVLKIAKESGHPDYDKLCELEKRITAIKE